MRDMCKSGSVGGLGGKPPRSTRPRPAFGALTPAFEPFPEILVLLRVFLALKIGRENGPPSRRVMKEGGISRRTPARSRPEDGAAYPEQACAGDPALRASVEALLRANAGASSSLDRPAPAPVATVEQQPASPRRHLRRASTSAEAPRDASFNEF
jgi:hypothetical protein